MDISQSIKNLGRQKWKMVIFVLIIGSGIFFRTFHFSKWLHFEIDQVYDFDIVSPAVENGITNLPLLGPNVGGGLTRLGPAFYYMEYISAKIFGNTPEGHAADTLILSILAMPLFYVFCKRYFSDYVSLGLLAIFSSSIYLVMYSRFSWSPNVLPFLMLFSFYALLRSVSAKEIHPARWFLISVAAVTVTSQIHLNSFFVVPLMAVLFVIIKRPRFNWKVWLASLGIIFLIYSPVILNDIQTHGQNLDNFITKFQKTSPEGLFKFNKVIQSFEFNAYEYFFINTSADPLSGLTTLSGNGFSCKHCSENLSLKIISIIVLFLALAIFSNRLFKEKDIERKNFLILIIVWFLASFYLVYSIADGYKMYPRFFLLMSPLAILLYGFILETIKPRKNKARLAIFVAIIAVLAFFNVRRINTAFAQLGNDPQTANDYIETGDVFPDTNRITAEEQQAVADYIRSKAEENNYPVYLNIRSEYAPSFWYFLEKRGVHYFDKFNKKSTYSQGNYFSVTYAYASAYNNLYFQEKESKIFGKLRVQYLQPLQAISARQPDTAKTVRPDLAVMSELLTWKKLFQ